MPDLAELTLKIVSEQVEQADKRLKSLEVRAAAAEARANSLEKEFKENNRAAEKLGKTYGKVAGLLGKLAAGFTATLLAASAFNKLREYEKRLVAVGKTADLSGAALDNLGERIIALSLVTPSTVNELLEIASAAGQLGVSGADNIVKFTEVVAKLGGASNLAGEEAASTLARLLNVTAENIKTVDRLASVIVELGNTSAATEKDIAFVATQVAQSTAVFRVGSADAAAIAAAYVSLGTRAELAGSATGRAFRTINSAIRKGGEQLVVLERLTGLTGKELKETFERDAVEAFLAFVKGLKRAGSDADAVLAKLGLGGEEVLKSIPTLAKNYELLAEKVATARKEYELNAALNKEAATANKTLDAALKRLGNTYTAVILQLRGSNGPMRQLVDLFSDVLVVLFGLDRKGKDVSNTAKVLAGALRALLTVTAAWLGLKLALAFVGLAKGIAGATIAMKGFTAAIAANPIGAILVAIVAAISALVAFADKTVEIGGYTATVWDFIVATWENAAARFGLIAELIALVWKRVWEYMVKPVNQSLDAIWKAITGLLSPLTATFSTVFNSILAFIKRWANGVIAVVVSIGDTIGVLAGQMVAVVQASIEVIKNRDLKSLKNFKATLVGQLSPEETFKRLAEVYKANFQRDFVGEFGDGMVKGIDFLAKSFKSQFNILLQDPEFADIFKRFEKLGGFDPAKTFDAIAKAAADRFTKRALSDKEREKLAQMKAEAERLAAGFREAAVEGDDFLKGLGSQANRTESKLVELLAQVQDLKEEASTRLFIQTDLSELTGIGFSPKQVDDLLEVERIAREVMRLQEEAGTAGTTAAAEQLISVRAIVTETQKLANLAQGIASLNEQSFVTGREVGDLQAQLNLLKEQRGAFRDIFDPEILEDTRRGLDLQREQLIQNQQEANALADLLRGAGLDPNTDERAALAVENLKRKQAAAQGVQEKIIAAQDEQSKAFDKMAERASFVEQQANRVGDAFASAFEDAIFNAKSFEDVLKGLLQEVLKVILEVTVLNTLRTGISNVAQGFLGGLAGGIGASAGAGGGAGGGFGGARFGNAVKPFADGGVVSGPQMFSPGRFGLIGEAGPEAILPLTQTPDGRLGVAASGSGGTTINEKNVYQTVNIKTNDYDSFARSKRQTARALRREL